MTRVVTVRELIAALSTLDQDIEIVTVRQGCPQWLACNGDNEKALAPLSIISLPWNPEYGSRYFLGSAEQRGEDGWRYVLLEDK